MPWSEDWITRYLAYTEHIPSPEIFREWSAITAIAGALERRVWVKTGNKINYPNLFTLLVATPGIGKTEAIKPASELWYATKNLKVSPDNVTRASLVDALAKSARRFVSPTGTDIVEYHSMLVAADEFGILVSAHDLDFLSVLNALYDNRRTYRETRRTVKLELDIIHPQVTILAGVQPGYLASLLPEEAWAMGFTSRLVMIYAGSGPHIDLFKEYDMAEEGFRDLLEDMEAMTEMYGAMRWTQESRDAVHSWHAAGMPPVPEHSKLEHYSKRRIMTFLKLCIIAAVARSGDYVIELEDFRRAQDWLLHAEQLMPDVFREMVHKSDGQIIQDLHYFMWTMYVKDQRSIHVSRITHFLSARMPSDKILRLIDIAERAGVIQRLAGTEDQYQPRPKNEWGTE